MSLIYNLIIFCIKKYYQHHSVHELCCVGGSMIDVRVDDEIFEVKY